MASQEFLFGELLRLLGPCDLLADRPPESCKQQSRDYLEHGAPEVACDRIHRGVLVGLRMDFA